MTVMRIGTSDQPRLSVGKTRHYQGTNCKMLGYGLARGELILLSYILKYAICMCHPTPKQGRNEVFRIRDQRGGIWDHSPVSPGIRDHRPWDRDQQFF